MSDPTQLALMSHRLGLFLKSNSSGSEIWADRVQRVEPTFDYRTADHYEIGRVGQVGITQDPVTYRVVVEENMHNSEIDFCLAGKNPNPAGAQSYNLGDLLGKDNTAYVIGRNDAGTIDKELEINGLRVSEVQWNFTIRDAIRQTWTLEGRLGQWYTSGFPHSAWGTLDNTSPGGVHGKEARIWFTSGSSATTRQFRLQSFSIRTAFPNQQLMELGRRALVGTVSDGPTTTLDFDVLTADDQPLDKLFTSSGSGWDLGNPAALFTGYLRVFDPDVAEATSVIKMFKLENLRIASGTPTRAQVRALSTMRYSLRIAKESTTDSGGVVVSNQNNL